MGGGTCLTYIQVQSWTAIAEKCKVLVLSVGKGEGVVYEYVPCVDRYHRRWMDLLLLLFLEFLARPESRVPHFVSSHCAAISKHPFHYGW